MKECNICAFDPDISQWADSVSDLVWAPWQSCLETILSCRRACPPTNRRPPPEWRWRCHPSRRSTEKKCKLSIHVLGLSWYSVHEFNSLSPGRFERNLRRVIFKLILMIGGWGIFCEIALRWMSDKSTLVQVMAWCRQATSHYLSQRWPRSMSSYGVTRPQWVN